MAVLRILMTRRWVILTLVFFALIPAMYFLGIWQFHRYQSTNRNNHLISSNLAAPPVAMDVFSHPGAKIPADQMYRTVTATGVFDTRDQFVVRNRTDNSGDNIGYYLVTPLITADHQVVLVNRGWVAPNGTNGLAFPPIPGTPGGTITVVGRYRPDETTASTGIRNVGGMPSHQFMLINSVEQEKVLSEPVVAGYLELTGSTPGLSSADSAQLVPAPSSDAQSTDDDAVVGKGVHLPYAIQWWLFGLMIPIGWWVLLRRDLRDRKGDDGSGDPTAEPVPVKTVAEFMAERRAALQAAEAAAAAAATVPAPAPDEGPDHTDTGSKVGSAPAVGRAE